MQTYKKYSLLRVVPLQKTQAKLHGAVSSSSSLSNIPSVVGVGYMNGFPCNTLSKDFHVKIYVPEFVIKNMEKYPPNKISISCLPNSVNLLGAPN